MRILVPTLILAVPLLAAPLTDLRTALIGSWTGILEYRDYKEPPSSTKRVKLPTWLTIQPEGSDLAFHYIYDDGPSKTVTEKSVIRIDPTTARYLVLDAAGKITEAYTMRQGEGIVTLTGTGTENNAPVEVRTTLRIGRNILEITRETAATARPFTFRHAYTLVRASPPGY